MKINTDIIYREYLAKLNNRKADLVIEKENYNKSKDYLFSKIEEYKHYIDNFTNLVFKDLKELDRLVAEKSLIHLVNIQGLDVNTLRRTINVIVVINKSLCKIEEELKIIENSLISNKIFKIIIYSFNDKISDEIVNTGYALRLGSGLGLIRIKKVDAIHNKDGSLRTKKRINWNESNKKKAEIIERGGIPYQVLTRGEDRKILTHNDGEDWFVYFNNRYDYLWHWNKNRCLVLNSPYYKFRPTIYNNTSKDGKLGNVNKLKQLVTSNSPLLNNFAEIILDGNNKTGYNGKN